MKTVKVSLVYRGPSIKLGPKLGRNAFCPCGSLKKFKNCCGLEQTTADQKMLEKVYKEAMQEKARMDAFTGASTTLKKIK
jgi:hypothetical protein